MRFGIVSFLIGFLFSIGLALSGMTDPQKVLGFLDVTGALTGKWDPSLIFVMGSAIPVYFVFWRIFKKRGGPFFDSKSHVPTRKDIDKKLILGSAIFGIGWGIAGVCPGPGIASVGAMSIGAIVFVLGYFFGSSLENAIDHKIL